MFNALNRFISRLDSEPTSHNSSHGEVGFQVLRNKNPDLALEPWFDFIIGINGRMIEDPDPGLFTQEIRNCAGSTVTFGLWSAKGERSRTIHVPVPTSSPSLGLTLQLSPLSTVSNIWHILDVPAKSPADVAGLLPYSDYILGTPEGILYGEAGLGELVEEHIGRPLRLYVYNIEYDITREVTIHPSRDWGGEGALGCVLGFGVLHRLPAPLSEPIAEPGETLFSTDHEVETARFSNEEFRPSSDITMENFFIPAVAAASGQEPATILTPPQMTGPPRRESPGGKRDKRHGHGKVLKSDRLMEDYFIEGERKSREIDFAPSVKRTAPPPPKVGGLQKGASTGLPEAEKAAADGDNRNAVD